jgi:hypothetical protein
MTTCPAATGAVVPSSVTVPAPPVTTKVSVITACQCSVIYVYYYCLLTEEKWPRR